MPRLPSAETMGQRPTPQPSAGVVSYRASAGNEAAPGTAVARAGAQINSAGEEMFRMVKVEEERIDNMRAEEAYTKLREKQLELTVGEGKGFVHQKGESAVTKPLLKDYSALLEDEAKKIAGGLGSDRQREKFRARAGVAGLQFKDDILRHVAREGDVYAKQVYDGAMDIEVRNATARWTEPNALAMSRERIMYHIDREAERAGWAPEKKEAERLQAMSKMHTAVVQQAVAAKEYLYAAEYYKANRSEFDAATSAAVIKTVEDAAQKQVFNGYQTAFLGARNDMRSLADLEAQVTKDPTLDEARKNTMIGRIQSRTEALIRREEVLNARADRIAARKDRELARWERNVDREVGKITTMTLNGYEPTVEQLQPLIDATRNTTRQAEVDQLVVVANTVGKFRRMEPALQEQYLVQLEAKVRKNPTGYDTNMVGQLRQVYNEQRQQVKDDPQAFAVRQGFVDPNPMDPAKPDPAAIAQRAEIGRAMRDRYQSPLRILTAEEARLLKTNLDNVPVPVKKKYFADLWSATRNDPDAYKSIMAQLAPDDPVTAIAGTYSVSVSPLRQRASDEMLAGQALLRPDAKTDGKARTMTMPPEKDLVNGFVKETGTLFEGRPQANRDTLQAAKAIYAKRAADKGLYTGDLDANIWQESVQAALGSQLLRYKGRDILLPENYDETRFRDNMRAQVRILAAAGRLPANTPAERLLDLPLDQVGDGRYVFRSGDSILTDKNNRPIIINMNRSAQ